MFSPDGSRVVTASDDNTARLWDAKTGAALATLSGHTDMVYERGVQPGRQPRRHRVQRQDRAAVGRQDRRGARNASGHTGAVWSAAFSPDGSRIVTASEDNTARLWDAKTGAALATLSGHTDG